MRRLLLGIIAVVMAVTLSGCFGDPVKSDLENYQKTVGVAMGKFEKDMKSLQVKMNSARTPEQVEAILPELTNLMEQAQVEVAKFQPKSDEVKVINTKIQAGMTGAVAEFKAMEAAFKTKDQNKFMEAMQKGMQHATDVNNAENELAKLAKEKKVDWKLVTN